MPNMSLREAAKLQSHGIAYLKVGATARQGSARSTKRCSCKQSKIESSTHCHHGLMCGSKEKTSTNEKRKVYVSHVPLHLTILG